MEVLKLFKLGIEGRRIKEVNESRTERERKYKKQKNVNSLGY